MIPLKQEDVMKSDTGKRFFEILILSAALILAASPAQALEYVESSQGLSNPQWEGGRTEIEMADINLDGNVDFISIGDHGNPYINTQEHGVMVYFGSGDGRFSVFQYGNFGYGGIAVGDADGDGLPDIGYGMHHNYSGNDLGDQLIEVALGDGTGQMWIPWDDNLATQGETWGMFSTDFGDVDNDGDLDLAVTSFGSGNPLQVYRNNGNGTWTHSQAVTPGPNNGMHIVFGDINKDGNLDIATAYQSGTVFFGYGNGQFYNADYNLPSGSGVYNRNGVSLGDVDNDGGMDLAWTASGGIQVWAFDETTTSWVNFTGNLPSSGGYTMTQLWDMNVDGYCDLVACSPGQVTVWTGNGAGTWTRAANYVIQNDPDCSFNALRVGGDVDHNGYPDIVHLTDEGSWINSYNHLRCYRETSAPQNLTIIPLYPRGGEVLPAGSARFMNWASAVPGGASSNVTVELSTTGPTGPWTTLAQSLPNNGRWQWTIPTGVTSTNCYLRYTATSGTQIAETVTPAPFTILGGTLNLTVSLDPVNPPIVIPASGGGFDYLISVTNGETQPVSCNVWLDVTLPGGSSYGPVVNAAVTIPTGSVSRIRTQNVPGNAPAGTYSYNAYVGFYPHSVWSSDSFNFTKSAAGASAGGAGCWSTDFDGFRAAAKNQGEPDAPAVNVNPNPFNPSTTLRIQLPAQAEVELRLYNPAGRIVLAQDAGLLAAGEHTLLLNGADLPAGVYVYCVIAGSRVFTGKLILLK